MPNLPVVVAYNAEIFVRSDSDGAKSKTCGYIIKVDLPDYYSDYEIFVILSSYFRVMTIGEIIGKLVDGDVTIPINHVNCVFSVIFGEFDCSGSTVHNFNDIISAC